MLSKLIGPREVAAEFLGTATLVMVALVLTQTTAVSYFIGTSVAITLGVIYLMFSKLSGAHFNPAITLGMWTVRQINAVAAVFYIAAQLLGGLVSWKLFEYFVNRHLSARSMSWDWRVVIAEATGTMVLAMGFYAARKHASALESALGYGFALFVGTIIASAGFAAGYLNPAVALGEDSFNWVYVIAPLIGGLVGINLYAYLFDGMKLPKMKIVRPTK